MDNIREIVKHVITYTFGENSKVLSFDIVKDGRINMTLKVKCNQYEKPLFLKIEKDFGIPCTQKFQIKREVVGISLCREKGVNVPTVIKADDTGLTCGSPWILEECISGKLIGECTMGNENKRILGEEFENTFREILSIESNSYGDTFDNGIIGKHETWINAITRITELLFSDCSKLNMFDDLSYPIVEQALKKALSNIRCTSKPVLYHYDLFSQNVFAEELNNEIHLGCIIDFGMSLFAPIHFVQYQTRKFTDFQIANMNVSEVYGVEIEELNSYDIIRIEPLILMNLFKYNDGILDYISQTSLFIDKCRDYLSK